MPTAADAAAGDVGYEGPSFSGASGSPSGSKPESKLWFNDGLWWASMFDAVSQDFHIFKLDRSTSPQKWIDTGTALDDRTNSRADVLWDGSKLFVASHVFSESPASGTPSRLYRYSYNSTSKKYTLDAGFPTQINNVKTETLVIDKNTGSTARLWATWVQSNTVYVNSANADGTGWGTPFVLPVSDVTVATDDISSLASYGSNKIVVVWSNQTKSNVYYSVHVDGQPNNTWGQTRVASGGAPGTADDHISLRSLQETNGKVYAAVKTSFSSNTQPLTLLLEYDPVMDKWKSYTYGLKQDAHTRPIVMIDKSARQVYMFATSPEHGGSIVMKSAPLGNISFPPGKGTAVMTDGTGGAEDDINNATSTKQSVDSSTGLVVLATNDTTKRYWHAYLPLGGGGGTLTFAPTADAKVNSGSPSANYGTGTPLQVRAASPEYLTYFKFTVTGLAGPATVKLRLFVTDPSPDGGSAFQVTNTSWTETGITYSNRPALVGSALGSTSANTTNTTVEIPLGSIAGNGTYSWALKSSSTNSVYYSSREGANPPQLVVTP